jgi:hypothetical protein
MTIRYTRSLNPLRLYAILDYINIFLLISNTGMHSI